VQHQKEGTKTAQENSSRAAKHLYKCLEALKAKHANVTNTEDWKSIADELAGIACLAESDVQKLI